MSVKTLLQLILFLLIFLIIGGIYYLYFYSDPITKRPDLSEDLAKVSSEIKEENLSGEEILIDAGSIGNIKSDNGKIEDDNLKNLNLNNVDDERKKSKESDQKNKNLDEIKNLTKEIEYITTNRNGDIFKISAKYGKTNMENTNILDLEKVEGVISSKYRSTIEISSDKANYNYDNQDSKFYGNVIVIYDKKIINCDNLDLILNDNIAVAYNNVVVKDEKSIMKAQIITLNTLDKSININSKEKIKIISN